MDSTASSVSDKYRQTPLKTSPNTEGPVKAGLKEYKRRAKLKTLAEDGATPGEREAARRKLENLLKNFTFVEGIYYTTGPDIFSSYSSVKVERPETDKFVHILSFKTDIDRLPSYIKWGLEEAFDIEARYHMSGDRRVIRAMVSKTDVPVVRRFAKFLVDRFTMSWTEIKIRKLLEPYEQVSFFAGLYEGISGHNRPHPIVPSKRPPRPKKKQRTSGRAKQAIPRSIHVHTYELGVELGSICKFTNALRNVRKKLRLLDAT